jgi:hypothetical protein
MSQRILVGARFEHVRVELGWPSHHESNPNCFPCLFIQFLQSDSRQSKMLQIFSKQAPMMDALITHYHRAKCREEEAAGDEADGAADPSSDIEGGKAFKVITTGLVVLMQLCYVDFLMSLKTVTECGLETSCLTNKLGELSLAHFDEEGICVSQSGSWAFSQ